jgi:hypothetical protein
MVKICVFHGQTIEVSLGQAENRFNNTTVFELKEKMFSQKPELKNTLSDARFTYQNRTLRDWFNLAFYNINDDSTLETEKYYEPKKNLGVKFVLKKDAITGDNDVVLRAEVKKKWGKI